MFAQQYQPQYPVPPQQYPQQGDALEQISKVLDFADKIRGRESAGNFAPGITRDASQGVGGLPTRSLDELTRQQLLLSNPALLGQQQALTFTPQQAQELRQAVSTMQQGSQRLYSQLQQSWQLMAQIMNAYNAMCTYARELENLAAIGQLQNNLANAVIPYVGIAEAQNILANAYLNECNALEDLANIQNRMLFDPVYLLHHAFNVWDANIGIDKSAIDYISQLYLELANRFDQRYEATTGAKPYPDNQQPRTGLDPNYFRAFSQAQTQGNPKVGQVLQRMHTQKFM